MSDEILTSPNGLEMLGYCPEYYQSSRVFKAYLQSTGLELDDYEAGIDQLLQAMFVNTAPAWALDLWEQELGLISYSGKPIAQRRSRIISKIRGIGTVTVPMIKSVAESYVYGTVSVTDHPESYSFTIKFIDPLGIPANIADLQEAIEEIKPAHLGVVYEYTYTVWGDVLGWGNTWGYVNGQGITWEGIKTWKPA